MTDRRLTPPPFVKTSTGVAVRRFGAGEPLVLLHGGSGSWAHWVRNVDALGRHFQVLALDQPAYGDSDTLAWDVPLEDYLDILVGAVEEITAGTPRFHLAAFSFGAALASLVAERFGPRLAALSMIGGAGYGGPTDRSFRLESKRRLAERLGREPTERDIFDLQKRNLGKLMFWDPSRIDDWAVEMQIRNVARTRFDSRRVAWLTHTPDSIARLVCPVAVIYGQHDVSAFPSVDDRLQRCRAARADVETAVIPDCGHWAMYEAPETVNRLLLDFHGRAA